LWFFYFIYPTTLNLICRGAGGCWENREWGGRWEKWCVLGNVGVIDQQVVIDIEIWIEEQSSRQWIKQININNRHLPNTTNPQKTNPNPTKPINLTIRRAITITLHITLLLRLSHRLLVRLAQQLKIKIKITIASLSSIGYV